MNKLITKINFARKKDVLVLDTLDSLTMDANEQIFNNHRFTDEPKYYLLFDNNKLILLCDKDDGIPKKIMFIYKKCLAELRDLAA